MIDVLPTVSDKAAGYVCDKQIKVILVSEWNRARHTWRHRDDSWLHSPSTIVLLNHVHYVLLFVVISSASNDEKYICFLER